MSQPRGTQGGLTTQCWVDPGWDLCREREHQAAAKDLDRVSEYDDVVTPVITWDRRAPREMLTRKSQFCTHLYPFPAELNWPEISVHLAGWHGWGRRGLTGARSLGSILRAWGRCIGAWDKHTVKSSPWWVLSSP